MGGTKSTLGFSNGPFPASSKKIVIITDAEGNERVVLQSEVGGEMAVAAAAANMRDEAASRRCMIPNKVTTQLKGTAPIASVPTTESEALKSPRETRKKNTRRTKKNENSGNNDVVGQVGTERASGVRSDDMARYLERQRLRDKKGRELPKPVVQLLQKHKNNQELKIRKKEAETVARATTAVEYQAFRDSVEEKKKTAAAKERERALLTLDVRGFSSTRSASAQPRFEGASPLGSKSRLAPLVSGGPWGSQTERTRQRLQKKAAAHAAQVAAAAAQQRAEAEAAATRRPGPPPPPQRRELAEAARQLRGSARRHHAAAADKALRRARSLEAGGAAGHAAAVRWHDLGNFGDRPEGEDRDAGAAALLVRLGRDDRRGELALEGLAAAEAVAAVEDFLEDHRARGQRARVTVRAGAGEEGRAVYEAVAAALRAAGWRFEADLGGRTVVVKLLSHGEEAAAALAARGRRRARPGEEAAQVALLRRHRSDPHLTPRPPRSPPRPVAC